MRKIGIAVLFVVQASSAFAESDCKALFDATAKSAATPNHQFLTETAPFRNGGRPTNSEIITTADHRYVLVNGKWTSRTYDAAKEVADIKEARADTASVCKHERDEVTDGQPALVYSERTGEVASQTWISKVNGLPLKSDMDIDVGGKMGKSHTSVRFDYANVAAPSSQ